MLIAQSTAAGKLCNSVELEAACSARHNGYACLVVEHKFATGFISPSLTHDSICTSGWLLQIDVADRERHALAVLHAVDAVEVLCVRIAREQQQTAALELEAQTR